MLRKLWKFTKNFESCCNSRNYFYHQCVLLYGTISCGSYAWTIATRYWQYCSMSHYITYYYINFVTLNCYILHKCIYNASSFVNQPASYHMYSVHALNNSSYNTNTPMNFVFASNLLLLSDHSYLCRYIYIYIHIHCNTYIILHIYIVSTMYSITNCTSSTQRC